MSTARSSESVFGTIEPKNTKAIFGRVQSFVLAEFTRARGTVAFVEVGANDGQRADPIHPFVVGGRWKGLLIEPLPSAFEALKQTYAGIDGLDFVQIAVSDREGEATFYGVTGERDVMSSFSRETILKHAATRPDLPDQIFEISVRTKPLDALLDERGVRHVDVLVVDTEGHDDVVLSTFDLERWKPSLVLFEHVLLSREGSERARAMLDTPDYTLIWDRHDCIAIRSGTFDAELTRLLKDVVDVAKQK